MKVFNFITLMLMLTMSAFSLCTEFAEAKVCNRIVAFVNNDIITLYELRTKIREMTGMDPDSITDNEKFIQARRYVLQKLIDEKISHAKAKELGIKIDEGEIDAEIEGIKKENNLTQEQLLQTLKAQGLTYEMFRNRIRNDIERMRLTQFEVNSKIVIKDEDIKKYFDEHRDEFGKGGNKVHIASIILVQQDPSDRNEAVAISNKASVIMARLKNGQDFGTLARKFSQGPGADEGGDMGFFEISHLDPELRKIVEGMSPGEVRGPIKRSFGLQIIKLLEKQQQNDTLTPELKEIIRRKLYKIEMKKRYDAWIKDLRAKSYIKVIF